MPKSLNSLFLASLLFLAPAYPNRSIRAQELETQGAYSDESILTKDELYFGMSKPEGKIVSEAEWQRFLNCVITPRFKEGLTVLNAYGQYLNRSGQLAQEQTKIVILLYENSSDKNKTIEEIIFLYKQTFQQESVLRTTTRVKVSF